MNELALFSGAGGGILGAKLLGWKTVCAVELDPFRCERIAQRQNEGFLPPFPIWNGDIAGFDGKPWRGIVDVVSGGFPCQDISAANPNAIGITGPRSGLWKEMLRIVREVGPRFIFVENSPMLAGRGLGVVLSDLAGLGYNAKWGVLGADDLGGFHIRKRMFIVANRAEARSQEGVCAAHAADEEGSKGRRLQQPERHDLPMVDGDSLERGSEHKQRVGENERTREQFDGRSAQVGDASCSRELQPERIKQDERRRAGDPGPDCLWLDVEFFRDTEGDIRATKPGLCGMANGVADRVDRIGAIGDGQVPAVVASVWYLLT